MSNTFETVPRPAEYVLIVGHGRSGTNWLLEILDTCPRTHCRNEPNEIAASPLAKLPSPHVPTGDLSALERGWDAAVRWTATHMGERDHAWACPKDHVFRFSRVTGLARTVNRRPRRIVSALVPSLRGEEWELPLWVGDRAAMARALPVLKLLQAPIWAAWVLNNRRSAQVLHIVRHPGGVVNSWKNRVLKEHDLVLVAKANRERLEAIARAQPEWGERFGDVAAISVVESELWYWRYSAETIHTSGEGRARYELIVYEQLVSDTIEQAQRIFAGCGLSWDERIERCIKQSAGESGSIAAAWKAKLPPEDLAAIKHVLAGSLMEAWWP